jgi:hypothetical protein
VKLRLEADGTERIGQASIEILKTTDSASSRTGGFFIAGHKTPGKISTWSVCIGVSQRFMTASITRSAGTTPAHY